MAKGVRNKNLRRLQTVPKKDILTGVEDWELNSKECYIGKPMIKAAYISKPFTNDQGMELLKCQNSCLYFVKNYCKIINIDEGLIPFTPYDYQCDLMELFEDNRFVISNQSRQSGKSTTTAAYLLWFALFNSSKQVAILANKEASAIEVLDRVNLMYSGLPFFIQQGATTLNKKTIEFENNSKIMAAATGSDSIRGKAIALLYLDEFAFVENDIDFFTSVYPTISSGKTSRVIISSTPNGKRGKFYQIFSESENGTNAFKNITVKWDRVPGRDEAWRLETIKNIGSESKFLQEYECQFNGSANGLIAMKHFEQIQFRTPIDEMDHLRVYESYKEDHKYIATVDCAGGLDQDYSVITIFDVTEIPYKIVAVYQCNTISPLTFPYTIQSVCTSYGECPVLIEGNTEYGGQISYILYYDIEYENVIMTSPSNKDAGVRVGGGGKKLIPAIKQTKATKGVGCANLKTLVENGRLILNDNETISEIGTFVAKTNGSYSAEQGCHDDTVMTCVIFSWLVKQDWFKDEFDTDIVKNLATDDNVMNGLLPFGITNQEDFISDDANEIMDAIQEIHEGVGTNSFDSFMNSV